MWVRCKMNIIYTFHLRQKKDIGGRKYSYRNARFVPVLHPVLDSLIFYLLFRAKIIFDENFRLLGRLSLSFHHIILQDFIQPLLAFASPKLSVWCCPCLQCSSLLHGRRQYFINNWLSSWAVTIELLVLQMWFAHFAFHAKKHLKFTFMKIFASRLRHIAKNYIKVFLTFLHLGCLHSSSVEQKFFVGLFRRMYVLSLATMIFTFLSSSTALFSYKWSNNLGASSLNVFWRNYVTEQN